MVFDKYDVGVVADTRNKGWRAVCADAAVAAAITPKPNKGKK